MENFWNNLCEWFTENQFVVGLILLVVAFLVALIAKLVTVSILSKTKHNEGAPCQHELAPIYTDVNTSCDDNQMIMLTMKKCAAKHNLVCLLHEKPFARHPSHDPSKYALRVLVDLE